MKALLVGEYRQGKLLDGTYETIAFAQKLGAEAVLFAAGSEADPPRFDGKVYLADAAQCGEYNPALHVKLLQEVVSQENPDLVVLCHSSYGWDLAPRLALALKAAQVSEVVDYADGAFVLPACNAKLRRQVRPKSKVAVVTLQSGAFNLSGEPTGNPQVEKVAGTVEEGMSFVGYEAAEKGGVDLSRAEIIVTAGRGIGKPENVALIESLANALGGEMGASRPVVDAGWVDHSRQVGSTGQVVSPKVYVACGVSGAIQHISGMKKSGFVVAINKDKGAPIGEVADVLVVADVLQLAPALISALQEGEASRAAG
ncbi:electron transfer flavoprotein subunit alpha/FixB family protein [Geoalkalibacter halelectricus]|uniref:Electron transfer flavoprotein subunit alpha/FixB family protein n=1 Tax=Geoalkalibacter halelectricus TaxID=2847045 RepID=A0ABY5ZNM1_9BACT|nr:electron transfer flavoprotein subunit alpha/FixB family protein [Geoalkalibacter halelectricus]MDO3380298.1 electron transfer flavoprotein subunit alpha/FixB family protein [Geoalkalibacter halelectricus]UWZ79450.1 electron transfer flavoprotein subunit alpha/FixB family protein [Geoalkalibacter halelectricus]